MINSDFFLFLFTVKLAEYISDLLYRYECVIVPDFGGFVANLKSASVSSNTFHPPSKQLSFNRHLVNNDGLLANYIASVDKMPFQTAMNFIRFEVKQWEEHLINNNLTLEDIGTLTKDGDKLVFEPQSQINYLTESYGLSTVAVQEVKRETYKKQVEELEKKAPILITKDAKEKPNYLKYAAAALIGISLLAFGGNELYKYNQHKQEVAAAKQQQKVIEDKIQKATFIVDDPLPSIFIDASLSTKPYHVIAGAFRVPENADRLVTMLKQKGFENARILGVNKWGLTQVSFNSYTSVQEARENLAKLKLTMDDSAWLLVQDL